MMEKTCLHVYFGDGKGKTTAAMGLALRCAGQGMRVVVSQFAKSGVSGELEALKYVPNVTVFASARLNKFYSDMNPQEQREVQRAHVRQLEELKQSAKELPADLVVLDELAIAMAMNMVPEKAAMDAIILLLEHAEVVVTGRTAPRVLLDRADYITEMKNHRHPYGQGISARKGIEW